MSKKAPSLVKISRPSPNGAVRRERLFQRIESCLSHPVIWLTGPAGSGKTTLVSSFLESRRIPHIWYQLDEGDADIAAFFYYMGMAAGRGASGRSGIHLPLLTPEYLLGISTFTRRYFENLYAGLTPPCMLVFDNYQEVKSRRFHELIKVGLTCIPEGITVVVISRNGPPSNLIRIEASQCMAIVGWEELRLTSEEARSVLKGAVGTTLSKDEFRIIYEKTQGWAAGLVLLWERLKRERTHRITAADLPKEEIFQYFAGEICSDVEPAFKDFLLKSAFLPKMTAEMAHDVTGQQAAGDILAEMSRSYLFTAKHPGEAPVYVYHPLFREFLLEQARKEIPLSALRPIQLKAADLLEEAGMIEEAARLRIEIHDADGIERLIHQHAPLLLRQGRNETVEKWIETLPESCHDARPSLHYWLGMALLPVKPASARECFEKVFRLTSSDQNDLRVLCWSAVVDAYLYEWNDFTPLDSWIQWLDDGNMQVDAFPLQVESRIASSIVAALMIRRPDHPGMDDWLEKGLTLARQTSDKDLRFSVYIWLVSYHFWVGDMGRGRVILEEIRRLARPSHSSPLTRLTWMWLEASVEIGVVGDFESAFKKITTALDYAEETGVHVWDHMILALGAYCSLMREDVAAAESQFLTPMSSMLDDSRRHMFSQYHYLSAWKDYLKQDVGQSSVHAEIALRYAQETGYIFPEILCHLEMVWIRSFQGRWRDAQASLDLVMELSGRARNRITEYAGRLAQAQIEFGKGKEERGFEVLQKALRIGRLHGYYHFIWWCTPPFLARLCAKALERDLEAEYARELIRRQRLVLEEPPLHLDNWPWSVKVYALGRFELFCDDQPVHFSRKVQKKPLEMLKALIAHGGTDVREETIADALWPDADGDVAHKSFATTLHRLRQLLGEKKALRLQEGRVSVDRRYCWVDALVFAELADQFESKWAASSEEDASGEIIRDAEKLLNIYRGHFLEKDADRAWTESLRERLKKKWLNLVLFLGDRLENEGEVEKAADCYGRGLEMDPLVEGFYLRLILCCKRLGRPSDGIKAYQRCRDILSSTLGIEPSSDTRKAYQSLLSE